MYARVRVCLCVCAYARMCVRVLLNDQNSMLDPVTSSWHKVDQS